MRRLIVMGSGDRERVIDPDIIGMIGPIYGDVSMKRYKVFDRMGRLMFDAYEDEMPRKELIDHWSKG